MPPPMQACQTVGTHDPDKFGLAEERLQRFQSFCGRATADGFFDIGNDKPRMGGDRASYGEAFAKILGQAWILQGILRRHKPPYKIKACRFQSLQRHRIVAAMGWIEGATI